MNQLFTFNSQQFTSHLKPSNQKKTLPVNFSSQNKEQQDSNVDPSKKRMKRYEQIMEIASRQALKDQQNQIKRKDQLRNGIIQHFSNQNSSVNTVALKKPKKCDEILRDRNKRCNSEMSVNNHDQSMLFTFYPSQGVEKEKITHIQSTKEIDLKKQTRSSSFKKSPVINYPQSNAILPKIFRIKSGVEQMPRLHKRQKNLSQLAIEAEHRNTHKQLNRNLLIKNYPNSCLAKDNSDMDLSIGKLQMSKNTISLKRAFNLQRQ